MKRHARARYSVKVPVTPVDAQPTVDRRAVHTEDQLTRWRSVAAGRRRAYELAQWVEAEQARRRRRRWMRGFRGVVTSMMVLAFSIGVVALQPGPEAEARAPVPLPEMTEASTADLASGVMMSDAVLLASAAHPVGTSSLGEIEPVHPNAERFVGPTSRDIVGVAHDSVTHWSDADYQWVTFEVANQEPTWIRWRDPNGGYPIEAMPCAFPSDEGHQCRAGRSHHRLARALREGAVAGTWTIEACVGEVCQVVDAVVIGEG
ncbi:MAG: hypothetical protein AAGA48_08085 [Myxococcota bacterium]